MRETTPKLGADIIIGVDTHKLTHAAVAISALGARLGTMTIPANGCGYLALLGWARSLGSVRAFGVEGTGSYGAGLSRFLNCLVAEHCWDPVGLAIVDYAYRFERLKGAVQGGR
ncbi:hypothetical protein J8J14_21350 [Roseomonas sp. SSH11]|uniref:Transposase IS110-like N-terminal domain-containing protein n=1 Tax=Pararoseomonas baculiformis TaxID=2820812 RepID=A0ABS4AJX4_9PROT|nr:transposase [Pararoseomonas baculiformis]MBP0447320.1 hypothetical protein [Pararoseomonas baculiformis]